MRAPDSSYQLLHSPLLRRADWRFLAGIPAPARSLCLASGRLAQATRLISEQIVEPQSNLTDACDLAVVGHPDQATLRQAWQALQPGGVCYSEWRSPWVGGLPGVQRRLEAAGFTQVTAYWPWPLPDLASPAFWLPLDAPQALRYFLEKRPQASSPPRRIGQAALRMIWQIARQARLLAPLCVVARKLACKSAPGRPGENTTLLDSLHQRWQTWDLGPPPSRLSWLLLTGGRSHLNKLVALIFVDAVPVPRLIIKLPRVPESVPALAQEAANLQAVQSQSATAGIPRVLFHDEWAGQPILGETFLMGQPLYQALRRETYHTLAIQTTDWLADLAGQAPACAAALWWPRLVEPALVDFERAFGAVISPEQISLTRARLATLPALPPVCEQRDCSPWNVLLTPENQLAVLDWESAEPHGLPGLDLIYFLTYLAFFVEGIMETGNFGEAYRRALTPTTFTGQSVLECQQRYVTRLGLAPTVLHPLRLLTWLIHARSEYKRLEAAAGGPPSADALQRSLFFTLWKEELQHGE